MLTVLVQLCCQPLDTIKVRMQLSKSGMVPGVRLFHPFRRGFAHNTVHSIDKATLLYRNRRTDCAT